LAGDSLRRFRVISLGDEQAVEVLIVNIISAGGEINNGREARSETELTSDISNSLALINYGREGHNLQGRAPGGKSRG
jgi:hypothetical protein